MDHLPKIGDAVRYTGTFQELFGGNSVVIKTHPAGVKSAIAGNNNLEITFVDAVGRKQVVNLSPDARKHMMTALLTKPAHLKPEEPDPFENERFLNVIGFQTATVANGQPALMLHLGGNLSLGITFPEAGKKAIQEIAATYGDLSHIDLEKIDTESRH